jgi:hypothetical protein
MSINRAYYFSGALVFLVLVPYMFGISILVPEDKLLIIQLIALLVVVSVWGIIYIFKIAMIEELIVVLFFVILEGLHPTLTLKFMGIFHDNNLKTLYGTCYYSAGSKFPESMIGGLEGFSDVTVLQKLFVNGKGCEIKQEVKVYVFEGFYGHRISYVELTSPSTLK